VYGELGPGGVDNLNGSLLTAAPFEWEPTKANAPKSEALNEIVVCTSTTYSNRPCELSIQLLSKLREILRTFSQSPAGEKLCKKKDTFSTVSGSTMVMRICPAMIAGLVSSSAFRAFELQCCQIQRLDLRRLSLSERLLFFCNIFNMITVHAIILRGTPGNNLLERSVFMRSSKYNIGGLYFSLLDIEHGILRHSSSKPMVFGPLTISISFGDKDPRKLLVIEEPRPWISFCLFNACRTSPALVVLKDAANIDGEIKKQARKFLLDNIRVDHANKSIEMPGLVRIYWTDFGGNRLKVLKLISQVCGSKFQTELAPLLSDGAKPKVEFSVLDWTPMVVL
jgi:hypothetical protein